VLWILKQFKTQRTREDERLLHRSSHLSYIHVYSLFLNQKFRLKYACG